MPNDQKKPIEAKKRTRNVADGLGLDVDVVIDAYNKANPTLKPMTKITLAKELGVHAQVFSQWKKQAPYIVLCLMKLMTIGQCSFETMLTKETETL